MLLGERLERPVLAREDDITDIINRIFGESTRSEGSVSDVLGDSVNAIDEFNEDAVEDLLEDSSEAPFIRLVNMILAQAVRAGASDIHIEPYRDVSRVRFRLDGVLYERHTLNKAHHAAVVSRIKVMGETQHRGKASAAGRAHRHFPRRASGGAARVHPAHVLR